MRQTPTAGAGEDPTRADASVGGGAPTTIALDHQSHELPEPILGRYRPIKQLGSGAFGTVWSARDERLERDVALKILPRERVIHARFEREARAAARLQHPAIVTLYEAAVDDEAAYLVSELVRGKTLGRLLADGKLSDREILEIIVSLCDALEHAHAEGVIHRDVKPSNVLVLSRPTSPGHRVKLTDFGVAHVVGGETLTRAGDVIGTLAYMAPEQAQGGTTGRAPAVTPAVDLYSLAVVAYEALTGVNPLRSMVGDGRRRALRTHVPPVRRQRRDLPQALCAGIDRALSPRPTERGTIADLRAAVIESRPDVGEERGVVTDHWRPRDQSVVTLGMRRETSITAPGREPRRSDVAAPSPARRSPVWLERGLLATATGLSAGWMSAHLHGTHQPVAPVMIALVAGLATLLLLNLGGFMRLVMLVTALPFAVVILGPLGLAGAWPGVVGRTVDGWVRRAIIAGAGLVWLVGAGALTSRDLYWRAGSFHTALAGGGSHSGGATLSAIWPANSPLLAAALVWAAAAALTPILIRARYPRIGLLVAVVGSAIVVAGVQALVTRPPARPLRDAALGAVVGGVFAAWPALRTLTRDLRRNAGVDPIVP